MDEVGQVVLMKCRPIGAKSCPNSY